MNTLEFIIDTSSNFDYFVYNCDELVCSGNFIATCHTNIRFNFVPKGLNKIKFYVFKSTSPVAVTDIVFDGWCADHATLSCKYFPIENEVEDLGTFFSGSHLSRDGFMLLAFQWPFDEWYFNWIDKEWNQLFLSS